MRLNNKKISLLIDEEYLMITKTYVLIRIDGKKVSMQKPGSQISQKKGSQISQYQQQQSKQNILNSNQNELISSSSRKLYTPLPLSYMF